MTEPTGPVTPVTPAGTEDTAVLRFTTAQALTALWLTGAAAMALWFVLSNLRFARFLRRGRKPLSRPDCPLPVYEVEGIPSPCLAGLFRPAVYLTPAVAGDVRRERHVLAHELTHARHLDPLWSLIRCLCLTVYWFDPLVWIAAYASRGDCELACDEGALRRLGEGERIPYGETLLSLIPVGRSDPMLSATTMTAGKRQLRERIRRIASGGQQAALAVFAVLCAAAKSGIDVRIITPGIPDKKYVFAVTRANYDELLEAVSPAARSSTSTRASSTRRRIPTPSGITS